MIRIYPFKAKGLEFDSFQIVFLPVKKIDEKFKSLSNFFKVHAPRRRGLSLERKRNNFLRGRGKGTKLPREQFLSRSNFSWGASSQMFDNKILGGTLFKLKHSLYH